MICEISFQEKKANSESMTFLPSDEDWRRLSA